MSRAKVPDNWPTYLDAPKDSLLALGVISLVYNQLEGALNDVFYAACRMSHEQAAILFPKIQNDVRIAMIEHALEWPEWPSSLKSDVLFFLKAFRICATNRHALMHSYALGITTLEPSRLVLVKPSRRGEELTSSVDLDELRGVADAMHSLIPFGSFAAATASAFWRRRATGEELNIEPWPQAPERPPLPIELDWQFRQRAADRS